jgi:mono/diheme cytochrome c family protein
MNGVPQSRTIPKEESAMKHATVRAILSAVLAISCVGAWTASLAADSQHKETKEKPGAKEKKEKGDPKKGKEKYMENMRCSACHGESGIGDGPAAVALNPKPRNYTDCSVMGTKSDAELFKVIKQGGQGKDVEPKLSPLMVAFESQLNDKEIWDIVAFIRSIPNPPCKVTAK